jgi:hypothetical protein
MKKTLNPEIVNYNNLYNTQQFTNAIFRHISIRTHDLHLSNQRSYQYTKEVTIVKLSVTTDFINI